MEPKSVNFSVYPKISPGASKTRMCGGFPSPHTKLAACRAWIPERTSLANESRREPERLGLYSMNDPRFPMGHTPSARRDPTIVRHSVRSQEPELYLSQ